jgi:hypothetical protein
MTAAKRRKGSTMIYSVDSARKRKLVLPAARVGSFARILLVSSLMSAFPATLAVGQPSDSAVQQPATPQSAPAPAQQSEEARATITLPIGTKLLLGLLRPLSVEHAKPGDSVYLQITFPVTAKGEMVIPAGAYVQGTIEKINRRDRWHALLKFDLRSVTLIYSTGYTVSLGGTFGISSAPDAGSPVELVLSAPLELDRERVLVAVQQNSGQIASAQPPVVKHPAKPRMCHDPGMPGSSDIVIPGSPGTPPTVIPGINGAPPTIIPGTPPTPPTVIPGTPGRPPRDYPCP